MTRLLLAFVLLAPSTAIAVEDLTVLPADSAPRKRLYASQLAEAQKHFEARKAVVEKLKTAEDVAKYQQALKAKFIEALGGFPEKTPLNARTTGTLTRDGYRIEKVIYESRPNHHVTANLYLPEGKGPFPGVVMPLGHSSNGKAAGYMQRGAVLLAKNGMAALVYDPIGQGERMQLLDKLGQPVTKSSTAEHTLVGVGALLVGRCTASYRIWDGIRSIDYLCSRPEVDPKKIGASGCSGGGTLTSYLMALDDRIAAAAPSCYITSLERLFQTLGPQDAEQNIPGQVAFGLDHADYILLRAPKPTLICAATRDFFDIQGTWNTFREVKRIYTRLGVPERVELIEEDAGHGYGKAHREGMARFFSRWLKGVDAVIVDQDFPLEKDADLQCTRTGQVLSDLRGKSCYDLNAEVAADLAKGRTTTGDLRETIQRLLNLPKARDPLTVEHIGVVERPGVQIMKFHLLNKTGRDLPALVLNRPNKADPLVIYLHERGKHADAAPDGPIETLVKSGRTVLAVDLTGHGEIAPAAVAEGKRSSFGVTFKESFLGLHLDQPLLGRRVADLQAVLDQHNSELGRGIDVVAVGSTAIVALHTAAIDSRIASLTLVNAIPSWEHVVRTPVNNDQLASVVPGVLKHYDLPDLMASLVPRPLTITHPVDATGEPLSKEAAEEAFKAVKAAYAKQGAADKFRIIIGK